MTDTDSPTPQPGEREARAWHHARWFDPHPPVPIPAEIRIRRAHPDRLTTGCETCGEVLLGPALAAVTPRPTTDAPTDGEGS